MEPRPPAKDEMSAVVRIGEEMWVKPPDVYCMTHLKKEIVPAVNSFKNVSVEGVPRHILDIRRIVSFSSEEEQREGDECTASSRRSKRKRRPPRWLDDNERDGSDSDALIKGACGSELDGAGGGSGVGSRWPDGTWERKQVRKSCFTLSLIFLLSFHT